MSSAPPTPQPPGSLSVSRAGGLQRVVLPLILFLAAFLGLTFGIHSLTQDNTLGTDFYIFYRAGQTAFSDRASPYSDALALQNQLAIFKHPSDPGQDLLGFAYPPYVLLAVLPVIGLSFDWAQALWTAFLLLSLLAVVAWAYPGAPPWAAITFLCFYPVTFGLILGNFAILIGTLVLLIFGLSQRKRPFGTIGQATLGVLLAWLTAKPQFIWLFAVFFLILALRRRQWAFLYGFGGGLVIFLAVSFAIVPDWPGLWLASAAKYAASNQSALIVMVLLKEILPQTAALAVTVVLGVAFAAASAWLIRRWWRGGLDDLLLLAWCGFVVYAFHPRGASYEHITFLLPLLVWACRQKTIRSWPVIIFWGGSLVISWAVFFISISPGAPVSATEWPLLFGGVCLAWLLFYSPMRIAPLKQQADLAYARCANIPFRSYNTQPMNPLVTETKRLNLCRLAAEDADFILRLVNEPSWLRFIGDRGVHSLEDAQVYIQNGPVRSYERHGFGLYLVQLKEGKIPLGMCGLIKRESLDDVDLGFAFLPEFWGKGYAFEAAAMVMAMGREIHGLKKIAAIVSPDNESSKKLLRKLGFTFEKMVKMPGEALEIELYENNAYGSAGMSL